MFVTYEKIFDFGIFGRTNPSLEKKNSWNEVSQIFFTNLNSFCHVIKIEYGKLEFS